MHPGFPASTFELLEREFDPSAEPISHPLDRYFENSAVLK